MSASGRQLGEAEQRRLRRRFHLVMIAVTFLAAAAAVASILYRGLPL